MMPQRFLMLLLGLFLFTACNQGEGRPGILDMNGTAIVQQSARLLSATPPTATPTYTPTATATNTPLPTPIPPTGTPVVDRSQFFQAAIPAVNWTTSPFTALDGSVQQLSAWRGSVVVVQTISTVCEPCQDQTEDLRATIERLLASRNTARVVFVLLSIDPYDTTAQLEAYQQTYAMADNPEVTWVTGVASSALKQDIQSAFGSEYISERSGGVFFVDKSGFGQKGINAGSLGVDTLEDYIIHLLGGPGVDAPTEEAVP